ncbi:hypothetical protein [Pseudoxanthomonas sp. CF125]|uniref:hypothetical protein n=1 Tax=Pseudoxanthomonas sp. CF125 TaxID=1855303 RepID=UPI0015A2E2B3|nr:hypothetical protein [Pseudoxanthomonas sp. CF125]
MNFVTIKPKIFWLIMLVSGVSLLIGIPSVLLAVFTGSEVVTLIVLYGIALLWILGVVLTIVYWLRQLLGRYVGMEARPIKDQIW